MVDPLLEFASDFLLVSESFSSIDGTSSRASFLEELFTSIESSVSDDVDSSCGFLDCWAELTNDCFFTGSNGVTRLPESF